MEPNGYTVRFSLLGHANGEAYFPQRADMEKFLRLNSAEMVRYGQAKGDKRGKGADSFRWFKGAEHNHYA